MHGVAPLDAVLRALPHLPIDRSEFTKRFCSRAGAHDLFDVAGIWRQDQER
jgi:hypothetical protein